MYNAAWPLYGWRQSDHAVPTAATYSFREFNSKSCGHCCTPTEDKKTPGKGAYKFPAINTT